MKTTLFDALNYRNNCVICNSDMTLQIIGPFLKVVNKSDSIIISYKNNDEIIIYYNDSYSFVGNHFNKEILFSPNKICPKCNYHQNGPICNYSFDILFNEDGSYSVDYLVDKIKFTKNDVEYSFRSYFLSAYIKYKSKTIDFTHELSGDSLKNFSLISTDKIINQINLYRVFK